MNCIYCGKEFKPKVRNQKTCGGELCKQKLCAEAKRIWSANNRKSKPKEPTIITEKKAGVCRGCVYYKNHVNSKMCDYLSMEGHSRLIVERENGGYKTDSCICYKKEE